MSNYYVTSICPKCKDRTYSIPSSQWGSFYKFERLSNKNDLDPEIKCKCGWIGRKSDLLSKEMEKNIKRTELIDKMLG